MDGVLRLCQQGRIKAAGADIVVVEIVPRTSRNEYGIPLRSHRPNVRDQSRFTAVDKSAVPGKYRVTLQIEEFGVYDMVGRCRCSSTLGWKQLTPRLLPALETEI